jgi:hypothetical protein
MACFSSCAVHRAVRSALTVHAKSPPWPQPTDAAIRQPARATPEKNAPCWGRRSPHPAAAGVWHGLLTLSAVLCGLANSGFGQQPPPPDIRDRAAELISQLNDPERSRRELATEKLEALGSRLLPFLFSLDRSLPPEALWRLQLLKSRLENAAIAEAIEPSSATVSAPGTPLREALAALFEGPAGGFDLTDEIAASSVVPPEHETPPQKSTYWEALNGLLAAGGCGLFASEQAPRRLVIRPWENGTQEPAAAAAGPLRIDVVRTAFAPMQTPQAVRVVVRTVWEPRLRPVMVRLPMSSIIAEGEAGEVLPPRQRLAVVEASPQGNSGWVSLPILLAQPPPALNMLSTLRGTVRVWLPAGDQTLRLSINTDQREPLRQQFGDAWVQMDPPTIVDGTLTVRLTATYPASEALASHRTWITERSLSCECNQEMLDVLSDRVVARDDRGLSREAVFRLPPGVSGPPLRAEVSWRLPLAIIDFPVDFMLRGISLPYSSDAKKTSPR